jgi:hypothetical protein
MPRAEERGGTRLGGRSQNTELFLVRVGGLRSLAAVIRTAKNFACGQDPQLIRPPAMSPPRFAAPGDCALQGIADRAWSRGRMIGPQHPTLITNH